MDRKKIREIIKADLYRYYGNTSPKTFLKSLFSPGFKYTYFLRKCSFHNENGSKIRYVFYKLFLNKYKFKFGFEIYPDCKIGKGLYIGHFGHIFVNPKVEIGCNVNLSPGVTIGQTNRGKNKGCPKLGNKVWVGTNALIVGEIKIGNNVLIGPGSYVNSDVPDNAVILGNSGKIISFKGTSGYIINTVGED